MKNGKIQPRPLAEVPLLGRETEQERIARAIQSGKFPHALLITGNAGVGKARLANWIAAALLCELGIEAACGRCPSCRFAARLEHPDIRWLMPHTSPGSGTTERQVEAVEAQIAEMLEQWRTNALHTRALTGAFYYVASIHRLRSEAARKPVLGNRRVFIMTDAETMVLNEDAAAPAANALLKLIEEPPTGTYFILTSNAPHRLPHTIRSRCAKLGLTPLARSWVQEILEQGGIDKETAAHAAQHANGFPGAAMRWVDPAYQALRDAAANCLVSVPDPIRRYKTIQDVGFRGARGDFSALLAEIEKIALHTAAHLGGDSHDGLDPKAIELATKVGGDSAAWTEIARATALAKERARSNGVPALVLHDLLSFAERRLHKTRRKAASASNV